MMMGAKRFAHPASWGMYLLGTVVLLAVLGATVIAEQLLAAPSPPDSSVAATVSQAANVTGASNTAGASSSTRTLYVYGDQLRPLVEETDGVQTLNIYGPGGQIIAQVVRDGQGNEEVRYLLADHLGSTRAALDGDGNAVARFEYGPHGETTAAGTAAAEVRYRYTGHPWDEAQGVYETPARQYDPTLGRFLSVDPQRQDASPYVYAGNNPVGYVDPIGGMEVPFFVVSGMKVNSINHGGILSRSIAEGFGLRGDQIVRGADMFNSNVSAKGRSLPSSAKSRGFNLLRTGGRKGDGSEWTLNKKLYWFIGKDEPVTTPNEIPEGLEGMRRMKSDFADEIVVIDFTGEANKSEPIIRELRGLATSVRLVKAGLDATKAGENRYGEYKTADAITHGGVKYTVKDFGDLVDRSHELDEVIDEKQEYQQQWGGFVNWDSPGKEPPPNGGVGMGQLGPDISGGAGLGSLTSPTGTSEGETTPHPLDMVRGLELPLPSGPPITTLEPFVGD